MLHSVCVDLAGLLQMGHALPVQLEGGAVGAPCRAAMPMPPPQPMVLGLSSSVSAQLATMALGEGPALFAPQAPSAQARDWCRLAAPWMVL